MVMVLAATNLPWELDEALRRRLEKRIYVPLPDECTRVALFKLALEDVELNKKVNLPELARLSKGYSGADISNVCRDAALMPMRRRIKGMKPAEIKELQTSDMTLPIEHEDFKKALKKVSTSVSPTDLSRYSKWSEEYGAI